MSVLVFFSFRLLSPRMPQFAAGAKVAVFEFVKRVTIKVASRHDHDFTGRRERLLMQTEQLAKDSFSTVPLDRFTDASGGNDPKSPNSRFPLSGFRDHCLDPKRTDINSLSGSANRLKIFCPTKALARGEAH